MRRTPRQAGFYPLLACLLAGCGNPSAGLTFDLRWVGAVTPDNQVTCGPATRGTLTRRANTFTFAPSDGVLVIAGDIDPSGHLQGTLALTGADHKPYPLILDGTLTPTGFQGTYKTPRCLYQVALHAPA